MKLSPDLFREFHQALLDAFPSRGSLEIMVGIGMGINLEAVAGSRNLSEVVFNLIQWAEANGRIGELVQKAQEHNPGNEALNRFAKKDWFAPGDPKPIPIHLNAVAILKCLQNRYSLVELRKLCFVFGVDWENIAGSVKDEKIISLIEYADKRDRLGDLYRIMREEFPDIPC